MTISYVTPPIEGAWAYELSDGRKSSRHAHKTYLDDGDFQLHFPGDLVAMATAGWILDVPGGVGTKPVVGPPPPEFRIGQPPDRLDPEGPKRSWLFVPGVSPEFRLSESRKNAATDEPAPTR